MSSQKYLRTNFEDDDDHLVDTSPGAAVGGVSVAEGSSGAAGGGLERHGGPGGRPPHVSVYTTTVAFGGVDSGPAVPSCSTLNRSNRRHAGKSCYQLTSVSWHNEFSDRAWVFWRRRTLRGGARVFAARGKRP